ncbi:phenazine biosynthesis protein [Xenorhabdus bovienii]|uniref:PhzA/PhzB family protein n=2 Tax=Xenorhabdus bovienii TaxID=40576 RepID=UPI0023B24CC6|nr:PhzA/PhzB family protein [Xenorhabdus bovienii]MDE1488539.1 phenazine biosynthesis protein [Xenorhabdus bovienii]MDE1497182.1 phenazine biosynthesis protein [Xenorhabdus bovienii]MDE9475165.1 phenazine biosynthesis protein [Xenorhabdus bovienii]MDE9479411.1 phenazine biosynthesis protein [Xenorhabdus bovienii]MDE9532248.1 phenazine biosynthesis protein [Xenorhabdus bovienii]
MMTDNNKLQQQNRTIVEKYMATKGQDRLKRYELFTEDGCGGLWTSDTGKPIMIKGKESLAKHAVWVLKYFPDWSWYNVAIYDTQHPNIFWVECDGKGIIRFDDYPENIYENHFIHYFEFENGKIKLQREFMNPCQQFKALGIELPKINRSSMPT